jgi:hypothetical protein
VELVDVAVVELVVVAVDVAVDVVVDVDVSAEHMVVASTTLTTRTSNFMQEVCFTKNQTEK